MKMHLTLPKKKTDSHDLNPFARPDETVLVERCLAGNRAAQYDLYRRYVGAMFHTVVRIVGSREDAEDLTQEVFAKAFLRLDSFRQDATLGAWLKRIAVNTSLNFLRTADRLRFEEMDDNLSVAEPGQAETWDKADLHRVHEGIKKLPDGCRTVFTLYLLEGYDHREISHILGITESTSKTQYRRAKRLLREGLAR